jgi:acetyl esterase/lipase
MPLHPDLEAFLDLVNAADPAKRRPMSRMTPSEARADYAASTLSLDRRGADVEVQAVSIARRDDGVLPARLYRGPSERRPLPTLLFFHGGGYVLGGLDSHDSLCRDLARRAACAVLAVDYRLAPEHRFPTAFFDAEDAQRWLEREGPRLGLDTSRVAVGGDSVGGTLAIALSIAARELGRPQPVLQLLMYPCTSGGFEHASHDRYARGYLLEQDTLRWMFAHYLHSESDRRDWRFAPLQAEDLSGLARAHIALAEYDPLVDEGLAYAQRLNDAGVAARAQVYPGMVHDFARLGTLIEEADQLRSDLAHELRAAFE